MGPKENFTDEEWKNFVSLPYTVSMAVIGAAPSFFGAWGETKAMMQEPVHLAAESGEHSGRPGIHRDEGGGEGAHQRAAESDAA